MTACPKTEIIRDREHLDWVKTLPCLVCGNSLCDPHHIRRGSGTGVGMTPSDNLAVPLCRAHHRELHDKGELTYLYDFGGWERARVLANELHKVTGRSGKALELIRRWKR